MATAPLVDRRWLLKAGVPFLVGALIAGIICGAAGASERASMTVLAIYVIVGVLVLFRPWAWRR